MSPVHSDTIPATTLPNGWEVLSGDGMASGQPVSREFTVKQGGGMNKDEKVVAAGVVGLATAVTGFWGFQRLRELTNENQELRNYVSACEQQYQISQASLNEQSERVVQQIGQIRALKAENNRLQAIVANRDAETERLRGEVSKLEADLHRKTEDTERLARSFEKLSKSERTL
jgi:hypothetical protein